MVCLFWLSWSATLLASDQEGALRLSPELLSFILALPAILLGIGLHEWAHAWTAWKLGDQTPEEEGRLSLNPLDHLDPLGTILIVAGVLWRMPIIGWGKPVHVRPASFRRPIEDYMKVALAGPMMNLLIAGCSLIVLHGWSWASSSLGGALPPALQRNLDTALFQLIVLNFSLAAFNMIPIPPLDGSKVMENFVSAETIILMRQIEPFGIVIIYLLMNSGVLNYPFGLVFAGVGVLMHSFSVSVTFLVLVGLAWHLLVRSFRRDLLV
ncbi:MAG: site-2 protease family protein [Candidatus Riflebacteria bacterium]|nr:site-2 protease family protein [Candidatus Riflebacteria bacterium]